MFKNISHENVTKMFLQYLNSSLPTDPISLYTGARIASVQFIMYSRTVAVQPPHWRIQSQEKCEFLDGWFLLIYPLVNTSFFISEIVIVEINSTSSFKKIADLDDVFLGFLKKCFILLYCQVVNHPYFF